MDQCPAQTDQCTPGIVGMSGTTAGSATQDGVSLLSEGMTTQSDLSAWRVRNSNASSRKVTIASQTGGWTLTFSAPAKTDVYVVSGVGRITHKLTAFGSNETTVTGVQTKNANNSPFDQCR